MANPTGRRPDQDFADRVQFIAVAMTLILLGGWIGWFFPYDDLLDRSGTPLGADFTMFYVAGQVVLEGAGDQLYDQAVHQQRLQQRFPGISDQFALPYRYPPFVAVLMAPLAALPYPAAFAVFMSLSCAAWYGAVRLLLQQLPALCAVWRASFWWAVIGWPIALETLIGGQASMFALLIVALTYVLLRHRQFVAAGVVLAVAAYKPNVLALLALSCLLRYPKMLKGFVPAAAACMLLSLIPDGWRGLASYRELAASLALESWDVATPYWKVHGLAPWMTMLAPTAGRACCGLLGAGAAVLLACRHWFTGKSSDLVEPIWYATLISINSLFNAYTPIYDLVLLMAGVLLTAEHLASRPELRMRNRLPAMQIALATLYFGPHLSQAAAKAVGLQPLAIVLTATLMLQAWLLLKHWAKRSVPDQFPTCVPG